MQLDHQYQAGLSDAMSGIEARLARLRGEDKSGPVKQSSESGKAGSSHEEIEELTEEEQVARIIEKVIKLNDETTMNLWYLYYVIKSSINF